MSHSLLWTVAYQASPSMGFSRQEYWSGLPFPSPGDLPNQGIEPRSPTLQADALSSEPPGKPLVCVIPYKLNSSKFGASRVRLPCYTLVQMLISLLRCSASLPVCLLPCCFLLNLSHSTCLEQRSSRKRNLQPQYKKENVVVV